MTVLSVVVYTGVAVVACLFVRQAIGRFSLNRIVSSQTKEPEFRLEKTM